MFTVLARPETAPAISHAFPLNQTVTVNTARPGVALIPLCVDLDGTLIKTDMLYESMLVAIKHNPLCLLYCWFWLLKGRANLKAQFAKRAHIDVSLLPYHADFISFLRAQRAQGRALYLCTAADQYLADRIAGHLGIFSGVYASNGKLNLSSHHKAQLLRETFGLFGFDYCGNSRADLAIWQVANQAIVVGDVKIAVAAGKIASDLTVFYHSQISLNKTLKAMRVYQWVKNILIFVPLLVSHRFLDMDAVIASIVAFTSFSLCASSVYLLNDMLDLESDRRHARKRKRPFAAGDLSLPFGMVLMLVLLASAIGIALLLPLQFLLVLGCYYVLTLAYSFKLKKMMLVDVFALAGLYSSRVIAGGAAGGISLSSWLIMFSITIFLSLAFVKRYTELDERLRAGGSSAAGRGYVTADLSMLRSFGTSAGYLAVIIMAIYMNSKDIGLMYSHRSALWGVFALLLFWVSWMWMSAYQGRMHDDPIVFALKDRMSLLSIALVVICMIIAI